MKTLIAGSSALVGAAVFGSPIVAGLVYGINQLVQTLEMALRVLGA